MVRTSARQALLNDLSEDLVDAYIASAMLSEASESNTTDTDSSGSDTSTSSGSNFDTLLELYSTVSKQRYITQRSGNPRRSERIIDILLYWEEQNPLRFRGLIRMKPAAFRDLVHKLLGTTPFHAQDRARHTWEWAAERAAVAIYRLGRSGNGAGARDVALNCGCSEGSVVNWTRMTIDGLNELVEEVVTFATEDERQASAEWVRERSGCEAWGRGWSCVDGTQIPLAWKPARYPREYFSYKQCYSLNVALVILPHSLRIIEAVVGFPGSAQDSRVWVSQSRILKKPRLHLDEGEFVWTDGGYGYSPYTVGPCTHAAADKSHDIRKFNYTLSSVRVRVEHAIGYLKNRFQCLKGYRGNMYREEDHTTSSKAVMACIVAHTFAQRYDSPEDVAEYLSGPETVISEVVDDLQRFRTTQRPYRRARQAAQQAHEEKTASEATQHTQNALDRLRKDRALDLREEMFAALFEDHGLQFRDTNADSRRRERTITDLEATCSQEMQTSSRRRQTATQSQQARRQEQVQTLQSSQPSQVPVTQPSSLQRPTQSTQIGSSVTRSSRRDLVLAFMSQSQC